MQQLSRISILLHHLTLLFSRTSLYESMLTAVRLSKEYSAHYAQYFYTHNCSLSR